MSYKSVDELSPEDQQEYSYWADVANSHEEEE